MQASSSPQDLQKEIRSAEILRDQYEASYACGEGFFRYPADWVIRYYHQFLKHQIPAGARVLDFGCGSGNNAMFFIENGYEVAGTDIAPSYRKLVERNLKINHLDSSLLDHFKVTGVDSSETGFPDQHFDFILANQVLYYLPSERKLKEVCQELDRILKPGGFVFFSMMGPRNYFIQKYGKQLEGSRRVQIRIQDSESRLNGLQEDVLLVQDEEDLKSLFGRFDCLNTGYFDQKMFEMESNFHFLFMGKKKSL